MKRIILLVIAGCITIFLYIIGAFWFAGSASLAVNTETAVSMDTYIVLWILFALDVFVWWAAFKL